MRCRGFTLIEVLTVIVIIVLLSALAFPSFSSARAAAQRAKTKVMFSQWSTAVAAFESDYGFAPRFGDAQLVNEGAGAALSSDHLFHDLLAGCHRDGSALADSTDPRSAAAQNPRHVAFHVFAESEIAPDGHVRDATGNEEIAVVVDEDGDGLVKAGTDFDHLPVVHAADGTALIPTAADFPASGVRAGVIFYAADSSASATNPLLVLSWK
ncbi:MAG TPA: prepilin-type N-terminal cleavage/methylation domain-containing protein [Candidatus Didemnitutus sp.]|nr:prepilin-type N-terminal cleavage/methylation domain-containing protein [Candidatus Didemnitutus sp.]